MPFRLGHAKAAVRVVTIFAALQSVAATAAEPIGVWLTEDGRARVRTERCGPTNEQLCGYIVWASKNANANGKPFVDEHNPDPSKRTRPLLGHQMLTGLQPNAQGRFEGKIYNGQDGKSYDVTVWSETSEALIVEGCMLAILCGKQSWKRVADILPGQLQGPTNADGGPYADPEWTPKTASKPAASETPKSRSKPTNSPK